jgi:hypothetical protein
LLFLLAAICSAYVVPESRPLQAPASRAVAGLKTCSAQAVKSRALGRLSLSRRQAVRSEASSSLFASFISLPASVVFASAPERLVQSHASAPEISASPGVLPVLIQRPPPAAA